MIHEESLRLEQMGVQGTKGKGDVEMRSLFFLAKVSLEMRKLWGCSF